MKSSTLKTAALAAACVLASSAMAETGKVAMLVASSNVETLNSQERAAAEFFTRHYTNGELVSVNDAASLTTDKYDAVWVHIDRVGIAAGANSLPDGFGSAATVQALKSYLNAGGNIYLSKHATQLAPAIDRIPDNYAPGIVGTGDGGNGTDVWTIQAIIGAMNIGADESQVYDHTAHNIYAGLETLPAGHEYANFVTATYPMEGTGDGSEMWREDHNCMWDLNAYSYTSEGKNTTEQFERDFNCQVLGTWGHVQDYCVAGIVEFKPENGCGTLIANGLAACEWAPRSGVNKYHANLEKLTANTIDYLVSKSFTGVDSFAVEDASAEVWYNLSGMQVNAADAVSGIFIVKKGSKTLKVVK